MTIYTSPHYGLRAPNDNELQKDGAEAMRDLALDVDTVIWEQMNGLPSDTVRMLRGTTVGTPNAYGWLTITFPAGSFTAAPVVVVSNGDATSFFGHVELLQAPTTTGFVAAAFFADAAIQSYVRAYAEWAVNHGETTTGVSLRMKSGATGEPVFGQAPGGNVRVNWIAVGPAA